MSVAPDIRFITEADLGKRAAERVRTRSLPLTALEGGAESETPVVLFLGAGTSVAVDLLAALVRGVGSDRVRFSRLIDALTPVEPAASAEVVEQARVNASARADFLREVPTLSSGEVAELYGSVARNRAALAQSWRKQGRVFAVPVANSHRFPLFQFSESGEPKPVVAEVLSLLRAAGFDGWQIALWFAGALASLGNARPVDLLDSEPARVVGAAERTAELPQ